MSASSSAGTLTPGVRSANDGGAAVRCFWKRLARLAASNGGAPASIS